MPKFGPDGEFTPKWIALEITSRCNLRCVHCRSSSEETAREPDLDTAETMAMIDDIASYAKPTLVLTGGEPLLRDDLFELIEHGNARGLTMCLATNGTLLDDALCERLKTSGIRIVSLSLDGSTAAVHDDFRQQPGAFDGTVRAAGLLKAHGIDFIVNSSFTKRNQHDIAGTFRLAKELDATAWYLFMIVPTGRGEDLLAELISREDYEEILNWHYEQEREETEILMRPTCAPHYYRIAIERPRRDGERFARRSLKFSTGGSKGCLCAQLICFIDSRGDVRPCSYFPLNAGNLREKNFHEIWESSELFESLRDFKSYGGKCGACEYLKVCGGCRARAYAVTGDILAEEPYCAHVPRRLEANKEEYDRDD